MQVRFTLQIRRAFKRVMVEQSSLSMKESLVLALGGEDGRISTRSTSFQLHIRRTIRVALRTTEVVEFPTFYRSCEVHGEAGSSEVIHTFYRFAVVLGWY